MLKLEPVPVIFRQAVNGFDLVRILRNECSLSKDREMVLETKFVTKGIHLDLELSGGNASKWILSLSTSIMMAIRFDIILDINYILVLYDFLNGVWICHVDKRKESCKE